MTPPYASPGLADSSPNYSSQGMPFQSQQSTFPVIIEPSRSHLDQYLQATNSASPFNTQTSSPFGAEAAGPHPAQRSEAVSNKKPWGSNFDDLMRTWRDADEEERGRLETRCKFSAIGLLTS
jgi:hypothetical protein